MGTGTGVRSPPADAYECARGRAAYSKNRRPCAQRPTRPAARERRGDGTKDERAL
ncbi:hypothetical protein B0H19DRAFT_1123162 [Mycena capillaripes]|nr:hypothetical protein B0H19DRAFT_1123162 [Mycena capillaripes]